MNSITANELKTQGISTIDAHLQNEDEAVITVRGKEQFVVMRMEHYQHLREKELEAAIYESREEIAQGKYVAESIEEHMERISKE